MQRDRIGIDTGGTFTDFVWLDGGDLRLAKRLSTPNDPARAVLEGVADQQISEATSVVHGSTVATNALLERRGARTALITTSGFADVLAIGRQNRPDLYALVPRRPVPLVPRPWRFEVRERVSARGEILLPLEEADLAPILAALEAGGVKSVAVCLLFSFLRPEHEEVIRAWLQERTSLHLSLSSEILPEYREFERTATTVINAYVAPLMARYLQRLREGLAPRPLAVMQSNGGILNAATAGNQAARTVLSGPAGGVVGAHHVARQAGFDQIISFDMGGTSTDVALCPGRLPLTAAGEIGGLPLRLPTMDIHTVGAGGGSLVYLDVGGALHVGPESAGAAPGPLCYGDRVIGDWRFEITSQPDGYRPSLGVRNANLFGSTTDANLVLGRLDAERFLGGEMRLFSGRAQAGMAALARTLDRPSAEAAAADVIRVANATMERAVRRISVERGHDPRAFTLVAFGGAGPLHACELAAALQIPRVLIPAVPGVLSALGMLVAAPARDYSQTVMMTVPAQVPGDGAPVWAPALATMLEDNFRRLEEQAVTEMAAEGFVPADLTFRRTADMRYRGQSHELPVALSPDDPVSPPALFHVAHEGRYGYRQPAAAVEIVNVRVQAVAPATVPELPSQAAVETAVEPWGEKTVWFGEQPVPTALYERSCLRAGHYFAGPAVVFQYDTTTVIPPGWQALVDRFGNLLLTH